MAGDGWQYETLIQSGACRNGQHDQCPVERVVFKTRYTCNCLCHQNEIETQ